MQRVLNAAEQRLRHDLVMTKKVPPHINFNTVAASRLILGELGLGTSTACVAKMLEGMGVPRGLSRTAAAALARVPFDLDLLMHPDIFLGLFDDELPQTLSRGERQALSKEVRKLLGAVRRDWIRRGQ